MRQVSIVAGQHVAGYRIESMVARGGMAVVYRATELQLARTVALKFLSPELSENEQFEQRFMKESQLAAACDHPNIIPIYAAGQVDDILYIAMRYVDGQDLSDVLKDEGVLEPARALMLFRQVGAALDAAHDLGLVHRDVKPGNILVSSGAGREEADHVYLTDFGVTKRSSSMSGLTNTGSFVGTIDYIAPEQIAGKSVDARTDIYSLGCVIYEALTGSVPFERDEDAALMWAHLFVPPPPAAAHRPELGADVDTVLAKALAKEPNERFATCREFIAALDEALDRPTVAVAGPTKRMDHPGWGAPVGGEPPPGSSPGSPIGTRHHRRSEPQATRERATGWRRRRWLVITAGVLVLALGAVVVAFVATGRSEGTRTYRQGQFSVDYPGSWSSSQHPGLYEVLSPKASQLESLFDNSGNGWGSVAAVARDDPNDLVGVYLAPSYQTGIYTLGAARNAVSVLIGPGANVTLYPAPHPSLASRYRTTEYLGTITSPNSLYTLNFEHLLVSTSPGHSVSIIEFGYGAAFHRNLKTFASLERSLRAS